MSTAASFSDRPGIRLRLRKAATLVFLAASVIVCGLSAAGFMGAHWWALDLASHFRQQYLFLLIVVIVACLSQRKWRWAVSMGPFLVANALVVAPYYFRSPEVVDEKSPRRQFLLANVLILNRDYDRILRLIREESPDVVVLQELSPEWRDALTAMNASYPYSAANSPSDRFGIGIWSKFPLTSRILPASAAGRTSVEAGIVFPEEKLTLVVTHPVPPMGSSATRLRNEQLFSIARHVSRLSGKTMVLADLNATPWSHGFREFERLSGLKDASRSAGLTTTWPSILPGMRIPLDHCLTSPGIGIVEKRPGPFVGSDHLPLIVTLTL